MTRIVYFFRRIKDEKESDRYWAKSEDFKPLIDKVNSKVYSNGKYIMEFYIPILVDDEDYYLQITKKIMRKFKKIDTKNKPFKNLTPKEHIRNSILLFIANFLIVKQLYILYNLLFKIWKFKYKLHSFKIVD